MMESAYRAGVRAALIKLSAAPVALQPLGWSEHPAIDGADDDKPVLQQVLGTGAEVLQEMADAPQVLDQKVPAPRNALSVDEGF